MKLIYIVSGIDTALSSQVIALLNQLSNYSALQHIDLCVGLKHGEALPKFALNPRIKLHSFRRYPDYPLFINFTILHLKNLLLTLYITDDTIIHTRNELTGWLALKALKKINGKHPKLLVDVRGAIKEELTDYFTGSKIAKWLKVYMLDCAASIYLHADAISTVSESLKEHLCAMYNADKNKIFVSRCSAGKNFTFDKINRYEIRNKYSINDDQTVIVFASGGGNLWQKAEDIVLSCAQKGYTILNLSKHSINHPSVISVFVPYEDMPKYLSAADIGVIVRDRHIVNYVASPIKFAEYLACGLPVLANDSVSQIVEIIQQYGVGVVVSDPYSFEKETVHQLIGINRSSIAHVGHKEYGIENIAGTYLKHYESLLSKIT